MVRIPEQGQLVFGLYILLLVRDEMKYIYPFIACLILLASCSTSKEYLSRIDDDKAIFDAVKALGKHPDDSLALKALPDLYRHTNEKHLDKIAGLSNATGLPRWEKLIGEYEYLQKVYEAIVMNPSASRVVRPVSYRNTLDELNQRAAEDYYSAAAEYAAKPGRENAKTAYHYFLKADKWVPGYKDAKSRSDEAYKNSIVHVVINEVRDNSYYFSNGRGSYNIDYINHRFQQNLVRELNSRTSGRYPAKYYTGQDAASRNNLQPGLYVDLVLSNVDLPRPIRNITSQRASCQIEVGRDTSGRPIYQTVYATVNIERLSYTMRADMELAITDAETGKRIVYTPYRETYSWQQENITYSGDSRALCDYERRMPFNNNSFNDPRMDEVLTYIYDRVFPQVKSRIISAVDR